MSKTDEMFKYEIACGSFEAMKRLKEHGVKGLNVKTHKFQIIDKNAEYEIVQIDHLFYLKSDKNLLQTAKEKGLIF